MGQGAATAGRAHDRAGEIARCGIKSGRLRDERNQEKLITNQGNWISDIQGKVATEFRRSFGKNLTYQQVQNFRGYEVHRVKGKTMRILIMTAITALALPF